MRKKIINIKKIVFSKRLMILTIYIFIVLFSLVSTITFSDFTNRNEDEVANIKVAGMNYNLITNGKEITIIYVPAGKGIIADIIVKSLNTKDSKYELIYGVCPDEECLTIIETPDNLNVKYSSRTKDAISGVILSEEYKQIRVVITNNSDNGYYIKFGINAGYIHNTLALYNLINDKYNEEDITIAAVIDGEISTTFPTEMDYSVDINCLTNDSSSSAKGYAIWNGNKWVVNIIGADSGQTVCNVNFVTGVWSSSKEGTLLYALRTNNEVVSPSTTPGRAASLSTEAVLAHTEDDYGFSYYFRGAVENNYILFADMCWRIVRVTGDGSIKLALYNYNKGASSCSGTGTSNAYARYSGTTHTLTYNATINSNAYAGFMYGTAGVSTYNGEHQNLNKSNILKALETWYENNLEQYQNELADVIWCNDKSTTSGDGIASNNSDYGPYTRLFNLTTAAPTLKCPNDSSGGKLSKFTTEDITNGNGNLLYKIGLLTADEVAFAGGIVGENTTYYLFKNATTSGYWSLSPLFFGSSNIRVSFISTNGAIAGHNVGVDRALRPSIALIPATKVSGTGTTSDPYVVQDN